MNSSTKPYVIILKTTSWLRIAEGEELSFAVTTNIGNCRIVFRTRYQSDKFEANIPRELWVEITGSAHSLEEAANVYGKAAFNLSNILSLSANAYAGELEYHFAYSANPDDIEHEYFENFLLDETGLPIPARNINIPATLGLIEKLENFPYRSQIHRAISQYHTALSYWQHGKSIFALSHLWMAIENITKPLLAKECLRRGYTNPSTYSEKLSTEWGIKIKELDGSIRRRMIFQGDNETYKMAKEASNEFEHGYEEFEKIKEKTDNARLKTAQYVRRAIIDLLEIEPNISEQLLNNIYIKPQGASGYKRWLFATLKGKLEDLPAEGQLYPRIAWSFGVAKFAKKADGSYDFIVNQSIAAKVGKGVEMELGHFEMYGPEGMRVGNAQKQTIDKAHKERLTVEIVYVIRSKLIALVKRLDRLATKLQKENPSRLTAKIVRAKIID